MPAWKRPVSGKFLSKSDEVRDYYNPTTPKNNTRHKSISLNCRKAIQERRTRRRGILFNNKLIMQLIELAHEERECSSAQLIQLVHSALLALRFRKLSLPTTQPEQHYDGVVWLSRAQRWLKATWNIRVGHCGVRAQVGLGLGGAASGGVGELLRGTAEEVCEFVHLINNLALCDREGYFIFKQTTGQLKLRYKITKTRFLSNPHSRLKYLIKTFNSALALFAEQLQNILFYYRFPGFSLCELEEHLQAQNHVPLRQQAENILFLQHCFEIQRRQRPGSSPDSCPSLYGHPHSIAAYTDFLFGSNPHLLAQRAGKAQFQQRMWSAQGLFRFELETLLQDISQRKKKGSELILTSIKIKQRGREEIIGTGGYAQIIHGIYSYVPQASIYGGVAELGVVAEGTDAVRTNCSLVRKIGLQTSQGDGNASLQNECNFLKYIRNRVCPYVAKYFCNTEGQQPFSNGQIFLQYYPNNLGQCRLSETRKMKVMQDVCMALLFLSEQKLVHRDVKEVNIMVDRHHRGRLIDFGSVSNVTGSSKFRTRDEKIRSTPGYYLPYRDAVTICPSLLRIPRNDYYSHETFDLFGLGRVMENEFYLGQVVGRDHFIRHNLLLLSQKCREVNPEDRWTIPQVLVFLRHLLLFSQLRRQFWKWGFDPRFRAHELGRTYDGSGGYEWREEQVFLGAALEGSDG